MTDVLSGDHQQLCMGWAAPAIERMPLYGGEQDESAIPDQALFYKVACNAGAFIVKASSEFWVNYNLEDGISSPINAVRQAPLSLKQRTMREVLDLDELDHESVDFELVEGKLADYYKAINMPLVTYLGNVASTTEA